MRHTLGLASCASAAVGLAVLVPAPALADDAVPATPAPSYVSETQEGDSSFLAHTGTDAAGWGLAGLAALVLAAGGLRAQRSLRSEA